MRDGCARKREPVDIDAICGFDTERRAVIGEVEKLRNVRNRTSERIAALKKEKKDAAGLIAEMKTVADEIRQKDARLKELEEGIRERMASVPNMPHESVPHGNGSEDNVVVSEWGEPAEPVAGAKDHLALGEALGMLDFTRGAKVSGAGFPVYRGRGALLERALISFMLDTHVRNGYVEIFPPFLVSRASAFGTGQLPKLADQMYLIGEDDLYCIPTAEVPVTSLHREELLDRDALPIRYCAYSACFRREAGSYGKDTKGFLRVHQFNKVELVKFVEAETSYEELEALRGDAEGILQALKLPYRVVELCDADLSFNAAKCYDLEVWAPVEEKHLEVSSCSNCEDFQGRRMNIRYRGATGAKPSFVHTLNGSGLATSRVMVALLETYQTPSGEVTVPEVLRPYMGGLERIAP